MTRQTLPCVFRLAAATAHALDRLAYARLSGLVVAGDRCVLGVAR